MKERDEPESHQPFRIHSREVSFRGRALARIVERLSPWRFHWLFWAVLAILSTIADGSARDAEKPYVESGVGCGKTRWQENLRVRGPLFVNDNGHRFDPVGRVSERTLG